MLQYSAFLSRNVISSIDFKHFSQERLIQDLMSINPEDRPSASESAIKLQKIAEEAAECEEECNGADLRRLFEAECDPSTSEDEEGSYAEGAENLEMTLQRLTSAAECDLKELGDVMDKIFS